MTLQIRLDGETVDTCSLEDFVASNETLADEQINALAALAVGESYDDGGGAAAEWSATRVS